MANQATALRLEEEQQEQLILEPRSKEQQARPSPFINYIQKNGTRVLLPAFLLYFGLMSCCNVITANQDYQRQRTSRQLAQLETEKRHNMLVLDKLATKPHMLRMAKVIGLEQPSTDRMRIIKTSSTGPTRKIAAVKGKKSAWHTKAESKLAALLKRIGHGPGVATLND